MYIYKTFSKILMKNETADLGSPILVRNEILNFSYGKKRRCPVDDNTRREEKHRKILHDYAHLNLVYIYTSFYYVLFQFWFYFLHLYNCNCIIVFSS